MGMFCYQCQETAKNTGCDLAGVCGKKPDTANLQDLLIWTLKGLSIAAKSSGADISDLKSEGLFIAQGLFATITNANFDDDRIVALIQKSVEFRDALKLKYRLNLGSDEVVTWVPSKTKAELLAKAEKVGVLATENVDVRSLRELLIIGIKGIAAYVDHAAMLGYFDDKVNAFFFEALASTTQDLNLDQMVALVLKAGELSVAGMALLDKANTTSYGNPEITTVNIGVAKNPGILISGHDLKDMEELLKQTDGTGVDVYTHSEMLPANYYPAFKKYKHFVGNYGSSWWHQDKEFASFNGPILMTTNCIVPVKDSYKNRLFTTGMAGYPGCAHIDDRADGKTKDFSALVKLAKTCPSPTEIETGTITGGFAHAQVLALADKVVAAVKSGAIKKFVVMAGCDGRQKSRSYFTDVAQGLPDNTVILTAGCAKYRYNKLNLGDIGGIPRVLDAGQCNDSYSLALIALKLKEVFGLDDVNQLPIAFDIAWYEQKAVAVLLALLHLGFKNIRLGPTLPAFLSPNVAKVLIDTFGICGTTTAEEDIKAITA